MDRSFEANGRCLLAYVYYHGNKMLGRFKQNLDKISLMRQQDSSGNNGMELSGTLLSLLERSKIDGLNNLSHGS